MRLGSLCTGVGGLDLAVEAATGAELAWCAEIDPAASRVLAHRFPGVPQQAALALRMLGAGEP